MAVIGEPVACEHLTELTDEPEDDSLTVGDEEGTGGREPAGPQVN